MLNTIFVMFRAISRDLGITLYLLITVSRAVHATMIKPQRFSASMTCKKDDNSLGFRGKIESTQRMVPSNTFLAL